MTDKQLRKRLDNALGRSASVLILQETIMTLLRLIQHIVRMETLSEETKQLAMQTADRCFINLQKAGKLRSKDGKPSKQSNLVERMSDENMNARSERRSPGDESDPTRETKKVS